MKRDVYLNVYYVLPALKKFQNMYILWEKLCIFIVRINIQEFVEQKEICFENNCKRLQTKFLKLKKFFCFFIFVPITIC